MNIDTIPNRYNIYNQVGKGGHGTVLLASNKKTNQIVAIKVIPITPHNKSSVEQEIKSLIVMSSKVCSPYIICYHDSFYDPNTNEGVIEMNYVQGNTAMEYTAPLRLTGNLPVLYQAGKALLNAMLLALQSVHSYGIIHNDIKPSNIVIGTNRVPVLTDFGISCHGQPSNSPVCTAVYNKVVNNCCVNHAGTSLYIAPEYIKNIRYPESDLWSLGATIYHIVTGNNIWNLNLNYYDNTNLMVTVVQLISNITPPQKLQTGDYQLDTVVNGFLIYDPTSRMTINQAMKILKNK